MDTTVKATKSDQAMSAQQTTGDIQTSTTASTSSTTGRKFNPKEVNGYKVDSATQFLPPEFALQKDLQENRWILRGDLIENASHTHQVLRQEQSNLGQRSASCTVAAGLAATQKGNWTRVSA
eukprot:561157-Amphidinium_carterae.2